MQIDYEEVEHLLRRLAALAHRNRIMTRSNITFATNDKKL
jgi:hypothetical protein